MIVLHHCDVMAHAALSLSQAEVLPHITPQQVGPHRGVHTIMAHHLERSWWRRDAGWPRPPVAPRGGSPQPLIADAKALRPPRSARRRGRSRAAPLGLACSTGIASSSLRLVQASRPRIQRAASDTCHQQSHPADGTKPRTTAGGP